MSQPKVDLGTGITIVFPDSGFAAEIVDMGISGISRSMSDTTHLATPQAASGSHGSKTFLPGDLSDGGVLEIEGHFNPDDGIPIESPSEQVTINWPDNAGVSAAAKWEFPGAMFDFNITGPLEDKMGFTASVKALGEVVRTPSVSV